MTKTAKAPIRVERVQTGLRIEKRVLKVLKGVAEIHDLSLGDLVEGIVLHAFEGRCAFGPDTLARIADLKPNPPPPRPMQHLLDEAAAFAESISDEMDVTTLLETDERLSFRRPGVGPDVTYKLRRGKWSIQRQIDLHGLRTDDAREALGAFIREAHKQGIRCVRVITGKGLGSPGKAPVLKDKVHRWLVQRAEIVAFVQAPPAQGGAGALVVLLQPVR